MQNEQYTVYFEGDIIDGYSVGQVKQNLAKLFKSDAERISQLFNGQRVALKKKIDLATAEKYRSVLRNAGALVTIGNADDTTSAEQAPPQPKAKQSGFSWSLAPIGSLLLRATERVKQPTVKIDSSHLSLASVFATETKTVSPTPVVPAIDHLSVAPVGEQLTESKAEQLIVELDLSSLSLEPPGALLSSGVRSATQALRLDLSGFELLEPGAKPTFKHTTQTPVSAAPDVSHLELIQEPDPQELRAVPPEEY